MEPTNSSIINRFRNPRLLAVIGIGLVVLIALITLLTWTRYPSYTLVKTPIAQNYSYLSGHDVYGYNGLAFYKIDIANNDAVTVLNQALRLPAVDNLFWADSRGALLKFESSFRRTAVEQALQARGQELDEVTQNYIWYLDFADSSLHVVSEQPINTKTATFSPTSHGFYYIATPLSNDVDSDGPPATPLHFYDIQTKTDKTVANDLEGIRDISFIGDCADTSLQVCIIARSKKDVTEIHLTGVSKDNKLITLKTSKGRILPSNSPKLFVIADPAGKDNTQRSTQGSSPEDIDYPTLNTQLYDTTTKKLTRLPFTITSENLYPYFSSEKDYYALWTKPTPDDAKTYIAGAASVAGIANSSERPVTSNNGDTFTDVIETVRGYGNNQTTLVRAALGKMFLFGPSDSTKPIEGLETDAATRVIKTCSPLPDFVQYFDEEKQFKIYFNDDASFNQSIATFSNCVTKANKQALIGYNFYLGGIGPESLRYTTN